MATNTNLTSRLETLKKIETEEIKRRSENKLWEATIDDSKEKYFITAPYPYTNGFLHLGHGFTFLKADFQALFKRMDGFNVLFPFAFHGTGTPIAACALRVTEELSNNQIEELEINIEKEAVQTKRKQKAKLAQKKADGKKQIDILKGLGITEEDLPKFKEPLHYLNYFKPRMIKHLQRMGISSDFSRHFITTEHNPYYDLFVKWQFEQLKEAGVLKFEKRIIMYSPKDNQPCGDEERKLGEGVQIAKLQILPFELKDFNKDLVNGFDINNSNIYLLAATTRAETVVGATNLFINKEGKYILSKIIMNKDENVTDFVISNEHALKQLSYQDRTENRGRYECLMEFKGRDLLENINTTSIKFGLMDFEIPIRALNVSMKKGTGIVMSVPSDCVFDYKALREQEEISEDYKLSVAVVSAEEYSKIDLKEGELYKSNEYLLKSLVKKHKKEAQIHDEQFKVTKNWVVSCGPFGGVKIDEAREKTEAILGFCYNEPESTVISRTGNECVAGLIDSWTIDYGNEKWTGEVLKHAKNMEFYSQEIKTKMLDTVEWLNGWSCSRTFGIGTRLPFDNRYLIDSLSDSTIYMAYYTIVKRFEKLSWEKSHYFKEVLSYVFLDKALSESTRKILKEEITSIEEMKKEFNYWYPMDARVSGKELIMNHLTMMLFNHAAVWKNEKTYPRSVFCNGHLTLNNEKMSKSTGNFLTLKETAEKYGSDASRLTLAEGGDFLTDSNFSSEMAEQAIVKLTSLINSIKIFCSENPELKVDINQLSKKVDKEGNVWDKMFYNNILKAVAKAHAAFSKFRIREALVHGFYELNNNKNFYINISKSIGKNNSIEKELVYYCNDILVRLLAPITPNVCEYIYREVINKGKEVEHLFGYKSWPSINNEIDKKYIRTALYINQSFGLIRQAIKRKNIKVIIVSDYEDWQKQLIKKLIELDAIELNNNKRLLVKTLADVGVKGADIKKGMAFAGGLVEKISGRLIENDQVSNKVNVENCIESEFGKIDEDEIWEEISTNFNSIFEGEFNVEILKIKRIDELDGVISQFGNNKNVIKAGLESIRVGKIGVIGYPDN